MTSWSPARVMIGVTLIPGWSIGISRKVMPACAFAPASVRTSANIQSANCAWVVQIFEPTTVYRSPSSTARVLSEARSLPEPGSE